MAEIIKSSELPAKVLDRIDPDLLETMIAGLNSKASRVAPCLSWDGNNEGQLAPTADQLAEARLILIGAVARWSEAGSGSFKQNQAGPFAVTVDDRQRTGYHLWPSEILDLQEICKTSASASTGRMAFSVDTAPRRSLSAHLPWCNLMMGDTYCSCGVDIAGEPIFEGGMDT